MPSAVVIQLKALRDVRIEGSTGAAVHGFWFERWKHADAAAGDRLHADGNGARREYTLSPLMHLRPGLGRTFHLQAADETWFRVSALTDWLSAALETAWLDGLQGCVIDLIGTQQSFEVTGIARTPNEHEWAGRMDYAALAEKHLYNLNPPSRWRMEFATPSTFKHSDAYFPMPLPDKLARSWLERWQAFAPVALPDDLPERVGAAALIASYNLRTRGMKEETRVVPGFIGNLRLDIPRLPPSERAAFDLLTAYAFYCGTGHKTTQGMGLTRLI
jgi:CRISPR-associated endoribonuclease Cas6